VPNAGVGHEAVGLGHELSLQRGVDGSAYDLAPVTREHLQLLARTCLTHQDVDILQAVGNGGHRAHGVAGRDR